MECVKILTKAIITTPIGDVSITGCFDGLHSVEIKTRGKFEPKANLQVEIKENLNQHLSPSVTNAIQWLKMYFNHPKEINDEIKPEICKSLFKGKFRNHVWSTLYNIPFGTTISYNQLANLVNNAKAARAVGTAMKMNPICIIIPCHRVIRSDGTIGQYASGCDVKQWLIEHEKIS